MATREDLMGVGMPAAQAELLGGATTINGTLVFPTSGLINVGATILTIVPTTTDGADTARVNIWGGPTGGSTRGAAFQVGGNESTLAGGAELVGGAIATGHLALAVTHASAQIRLSGSSGGIRWYMDNSGNLFSDATNGTDLHFARAGSGFRIKEGTNARMGTATLVGGTIAVANTSVSATTRVLYARSTTGGTPGHLSTTQSTGVSFTINSSSGTDTSTCVWMLVEPAA